MTHGPTPCAKHGNATSFIVNYLTPAGQSGAIPEIDAADQSKEATRGHSATVGDPLRDSPIVTLIPARFPISTRGSWVFVILQRSVNGGVPLEGLCGYRDPLDRF